jgi:hypothetical protein
MHLQSALRTAGRVLPVVFLGTGVVACYTMSRVPARYITTQHPDQVFVRDAEGSVFSVSNPSIVKDSLIGTDGQDSIAVNLRDVDAMVVRTISKPKTYGAIGTGAAVLGLVTFGAIKAASGKDCVRIANRNNMCIEDVAGCKYGGCNPDTL